ERDRYGFVDRVPIGRDRREIPGTQVVKQDGADDQQCQCDCYEHDEGPGRLDRILKSEQGWHFTIPEDARRAATALRLSQPICEARSRRWRSFASRPASGSAPSRRTRLPRASRTQMPAPPTAW